MLVGSAALRMILIVVTLYLRVFAPWVTVTQGGKTLKYRVTTIKTMKKAALPTNIYTRTGSPKLVLVTCGGPFDAKIGHYRDNIVVTAVPA